MNKLLTLKTSNKESILDIFRFLIDNEIVSGIFSLRKYNGAIDYGLITESSKLDDISPFYPVMPANAGQLLSRFTTLEKPIAAIIKPCEYRALIELVKREQGSLDNFLIITYGCNGVFPIKMNALGNVESELDKYYEATREGEIPENIREICTICEYIAPQNSDIFIPNTGEEQSKTKLFLNSTKAEKMLSGFAGMRENKTFDSSDVSAIIEKRSQNKKAIYSKVDTSETGLGGLIDIFGQCIGCHGCSRVCPICYCTLCDFETINYDYNTTIFEKELNEKGALRLPPDTIFFHLGRLSHMSFSCVGCGQCSDVCPADIPVATVFKKVGEKTAKMFDFVAGRDVNEQIPVMIFKEEEFPEMGE